MKLANQIVEYRKKLNLTQEALAEKCDVSRQAVAKWENGASLPDITVIIKLAKLFNISLDELVLGNETSILDVNIQRRSVDDLEGVWAEVSKGMKKEMTSFSYQTLFERLFPMTVDKENKVIYIKGQSIVTGVIDNRYGKEIKSLIKKVVGEEYDLKYVEDKDYNLNSNNIDLKDVPSHL